MENEEIDLEELVGLYKEEKEKFGNYQAKILTLKRLEDYMSKEAKFRFFDENIKKYAKG